MEDKLRKVALDAKKTEPNDWYAQRTLMHIALLDGNVLYLSPAFWKPVREDDALSTKMLRQVIMLPKKKIERCSEHIRNSVKGVQH